MEFNIGIDKTIVKNFSIVAIDLNKLRTNKSVELVPYNSISMNDVDYIKIKDNYMFSDLIYKKEKYKNIGTQTTTNMQISISADEGNNLRHLSKEGYDKLLLNIVSYIENEYGMVLDISKMQFKEIEIGVNKVLEDNYIYYHRVLKFMVDSMGKRYKKNDCYEEKDSIHTFYSGNKSIDIKFYNKSEQIKDKMDVVDNILRIEFSLKKDKIIKNELGSSIISEISQDDIDAFFVRKFEKLVIKKVEESLQNQQKEILNIIKSKQNFRWSKILNDLLLADKLIDITFIDRAISEVDKHNASRSKKYIKKGLDYIGKIEGNIDRINEIFMYIEKFKCDF